MKRFLTRIVSLVLCLGFILMFVACNTTTNETNPPITEDETGTPEQPNEGTITPEQPSEKPSDGTTAPEQPNVPANSNILVVYFSWSASGNTEKMANYIAEKTGAEIYEIEPLVPYPTEYTPTTEVAAKEKEENARPEIKNPIDVSNYDHIFVGFPIWWHTAPMIIGTFLESYNLDGKDIYPFFQGASNSNNSYYTETMAFINECAPNANVHDGLYAASNNTAKIDNYLNAIDFSPKADITEPTPSERQTIYLWDDDKIPSWHGNLNSNDPADFRPHILTYPSQGEIKGAVLICPGGAFQFKSMQSEGYNVAERLSALGYQCFIVSYRLSPYSQAESALDLARAVRYVRYNAKAYGIDENDIAIVGFSAGGILCGEHALNWKGTVSPTRLDNNYIPDALDSVNADVAAVGHIYSFYGRLSVSNNNVNTLCQGNLPPTFYAYGTRDPFYNQFNQNVEAAKQAGVTVESHIFEGQPHGFGAGNANSNWIPLFDTFLTNIFTNN